jgi:hypothetical protein
VVVEGRDGGGGGQSGSAPTRYEEVVVVEEEVVVLRPDCVLKLHCSFLDYRNSREKSPGRNTHKVIMQYNSIFK